MNPLRTPFFPACLLLLLANAICAQETAAQRHAMATNQLKALAQEMSAKCLTDVRSLDDWKARQPELRRQMLDMLGLDPLPQRTPLQARITGTLRRDGYRIEKLVFESLPGLYVTGHFYLPDGDSKRVPTILYLCGHSPNPLGAKVEYQDRAHGFVMRGFPCLVLDTLEFGEVAGIHHGTHNLNMWDWFSRGYSPAGVEVWNAMRALDYLETRPEVDPKRIGLTGISGGGAMTWYTAAVDERVSAAAPVCSTFTYGSQAARWLAAGQCDCIYYNNTHRWDFPLVAALIAPRPLLILSGQKDGIFPPDGYHEVFQRAKRIYDLFPGGSERIREVDADVGHSDPPLFLSEARQWMRRWLQGNATPLQNEPAELGTPSKEDLACLPGLPADTVNFRIQNQFTTLAAPAKLTSRATWERHRSELLAGLKKRPFAWFPTESIPFDTQSSGRNGAYMPKYADFKEVSFQTEPGVRIRAQLLTPRERSVKGPLVIYIKRSNESVYFMDTDELLPLLGRRPLLILNSRFTELSMTASEFTNVERTASWVGRTIAAMQVWDVLRALRWAADEGGLNVASTSLYGRGEMGIVALYAALLDERVGEVILNDPPGSHRQGPALMDVLRITDIPDAAGALAPRRLVSLTSWPEAFGRTRQIYRLQRAQKQFVEAGSLPEALELWRPRTK